MVGDHKRVISYLSSQHNGIDFFFFPFSYALAFSQVESFEVPLEVSDLRDAHIPFNGLFIRAPVRLCEIVSAA